MTPGRIWLACLGSLTLAYLAVYALANPVAFVVIVAGVTFVGGIVGGVTAATRWMEALKVIAAQDDHIAELEDALTDANRRAAAADGLRAGIASVPLLRSVPTQSTGEHDRLPMSRVEWDAVEAETVVHDAWLERLVTGKPEPTDGAS
jgi:hypothetical protein